MADPVPTETLTITATVPTRWVPPFLGMLAAMQEFGVEARTQMVSIRSAGAEDFRPTFTWTATETPAPPTIIRHGDVTFDAGPLVTD